MEENERYVKFRVHGHAPNHSYVSVEFLRDNPIEKSQRIPRLLYAAFGTVLICGGIFLFVALYEMVMK